MKDFLVIGGGIAGVSAAAELSKSGAGILLEAEESLGYHATGRSAAMFLEHYGNDSVRALNAASSATHRETGILSPRGFLMVADAGKEIAFRRACAAFSARPVSPQEAALLWPILNIETCAFAAYMPEVFDLDADQLLQHYARIARGNGTEIACRRKVTAIDREPGHWRVDAGGETFEARRLVDAAGAWADEIAGLAGVAPLGIRPLRRSMARLPAPGGQDTSRWPFVEEVEESWYAKPDAGAWLVSPAEEDPVDPHDAWADDMVIAEGLARYQEFVTEDITRVETTWAGLRSFAPDRSLVIGPDPEEPDFLWCAGQGGYGFQTAPAASRLLAALADGTAPEIEADIVRTLVPDRLRRR